jgi:hypothetical protein
MQQHTATNKTSSTSMNQSKQLEAYKLNEDCRNTQMNKLTKLTDRNQTSDNEQVRVSALMYIEYASEPKADIPKNSRANNTSVQGQTAINAATSGIQGTATIKISDFNKIHQSSNQNFTTAVRIHDSKWYKANITKSSSI